MSNFNYTDLVKAERDRRVNQQQKQKTNKALDKQKAEFEAKKKKRTDRKVKRAEGVMGAIGSFAESVASGMQAEGDRRAKLGLSGSGMAAAFSSGVSEIVDFSRLQKAKRRSALAQKLGFTPADGDIEKQTQAVLDALTKFNASKGQAMGVTPTDAGGDPEGAEDQGSPDPLAQTEAPPVAGEPNDGEVLSGAAAQNQTPPKQPSTGNPVIDNMPDDVFFGLELGDDTNNNGIPDYMEND